MYNRHDSCWPCEKTIKNEPYSGKNMFDRFLPDGYKVRSQMNQFLALEIRKYPPNCSKMALHFLKLSSIFRNFKIKLLNDFMDDPSDALRRIASTIFASSFDSGTDRFEPKFSFPSFPITPPILTRQKNGM